ncbi:MAG TPA: DUF4911 domain-containing protein [Polyangiaceae bacterium]|nr:DUF4911 domain-containing protein [Polyangiaceae bacterium]HMR81051.1 DUF4911 domain-containing protein [Polyangiaceae bacterium]
MKIHAAAKHLCGIAGHSKPDKPDNAVAPVRRERYAKVVTVEPLMAEGLCSRRVTVRARDVVYVKGIFEASEGLGVLFSKAGGDLIISAHASRLAELDEVLRDLTLEIGAIVEPDTSG